MASVARQPPVRILMLHGFTQSGPLFYAKTRALEKNLKKAFPGGLELSYPTAPNRLRPADIPEFLTSDGNANNTGSEEPDNWGWWVRKGEREPFTYDKMDEGLARVAEVLKNEGPFDGVVGFSQGGALAGMVASLLEPGRREAFTSAEKNGGMQYPISFEDDSGMIESVVHPPLKFAVSYSGFGASTNPLYQAYYEPKIQTPMLHFLGSVDTVVEEARSLRLVAACADNGGANQCRVIRHPGGHFLPSSQKQYVSALVAFIQETMGFSKLQGDGKEETAEEMKLPF